MSRCVLDVEFKRNIQVLDTRHRIDPLMVVIVRSTSNQQERINILENGNAIGREQRSLRGVELS